MNNNITPEFCVALAKMQPLLPSIPKSATNPHFKSNFAPHDVLIGLTNAVLGAHGFSVVQAFDNSEGGANILVTYLLHSSGGYIVSRMDIGVFDKMLNDGARITYFRRYAHFAILGIVGEIDDDGASVTPATTVQPVAQPLYTPAVSQKRKLI